MGGGGCKILGNRMVFRGNGEGISRHQQSINGRRGEEYKKIDSQGGANIKNNAEHQEGFG